MRCIENPKRMHKDHVWRDDGNPYFSSKHQGTKTTNSGDHLRRIDIEPILKNCIRNLNTLLKKWKVNVKIRKKQSSGLMSKVQSRIG